MYLTTIALTLVAVTQTFHLPKGLLSAVCYVESGHAPKAINPHDGGSASLGVCQLKLATARMLGFKGSETDLRDPSVNIFWAGKYLNYQLTRYHGDILKGVSAYNAGTHRVNEQGLTKNRKYVNKVLTVWTKHDRDKP